MIYQERKLTGYITKLYAELLVLSANAIRCPLFVILSDFREIKLVPKTCKLICEGEKKDT